MSEPKRDRFGRLLDSDGLPKCQCDTCTGKYRQPGYVERVRSRTSVPWSEEQMAAWKQHQELHR